MFVQFYGHDSSSWWMPQGIFFRIVLRRVLLPRKELCIIVIVLYCKKWIEWRRVAALESKALARIHLEAGAFYSPNEDQWGARAGEKEFWCCWERVWRGRGVLTDRGPRAGCMHTARGNERVQWSKPHQRCCFRHQWPLPFFQMETPGMTSLDPSPLSAFSPQVIARLKWHL